MLRVLTFSTLFPDVSRPGFGGFVERQTQALAARDDVEVEIVVPTGIAPWPLSKHRNYNRLRTLPNFESWNGLSVYRPRYPVIPKIGARFSPRFIAHSLLPVMRGIRERFPFDVIDAEYFYPDGPAAMHLAEALDVPFSVKARGSDIYFWSRKAAIAKQIRDTGQAASGIVAVSEAIARKMVALGLPGDKISVQYTGIDQKLFAPVDRALAKTALGVAGPLIVSVGALIPLKGQALLIDAMVDLPDASLWLIGDGPDHSKLQDKISALQLEDRVRLLGNIPHRDVAHLMGTADVMALASASEGLANVWVEALACGTPVVTTDVGGAAEVVKQPGSGAIVPREARAFAEAIGAILENPPDQTAVRATVEAFSWERNSAALFAQLSNLTKNPREFNIKPKAHHYRLPAPT
ncbi:MAG: glycosyltransferase [Pseudomonadota bacterium]